MFMFLLCAALLYWNSLAASLVIRSQSEVTPGCCSLPKVPTFKLSSVSARDIAASGASEICDDREIELERRSGKPRDGLKRLKLVCNTKNGEWEQSVCKDPTADDVDVQVRMPNWGGERHVDSKHYELTCHPLTMPEDSHKEFSWRVEEDGISKSIPAYANRALVPRGLNRYAVNSPSESTLVIKKVSATDLTNYTCEVLVAGKTSHTESVRLLEKMCHYLSTPNSGSFAEGATIGRSPGSVVTPVCDQQFAPVLGAVRRLECAVWGKWTAINPKTREVEDVDWESQRTKFCVQNAQCQDQCEQLSLSNGVVSFKPETKVAIGRRSTRRVIRDTCTPIFKCNDGYSLEKQLHLVCDHVQNKWIDRSGSDRFDRPQCRLHGLSQE